MFNQIQAKQLQKLTLLAFDHKHVDGFDDRVAFLKVYTWNWLSLKSTIHAHEGLCSSNALMFDSLQEYVSAGF